MITIVKFRSMLRNPAAHVAQALPSAPSTYMFLVDELPHHLVLPRSVARIHMLPSEECTAICIGKLRTVIREQAYLAMLV